MGVAVCAWLFRGYTGLFDGYTSAPAFSERSKRKNKTTRGSGGCGYRVVSADRTHYGARVPPPLPKKKVYIYKRICHKYIHIYTCIQIYIYIAKYIYYTYVYIYKYICIHNVQFELISGARALATVK